jgi:hypothetical protein
VRSTQSGNLPNRSSPAVRSTRRSGLVHEVTVVPDPSSGSRIGSRSPWDSNSRSRARPPPPVPWTSKVTTARARFVGPRHPPAPRPAAGDALTTSFWWWIDVGIRHETTTRTGKARPHHVELFAEHDEFLRGPPPPPHCAPGTGTGGAPTSSQTAPSPWPVPTTATGSPDHPGPPTGLHDNSPTVPEPDPASRGPVSRAARPGPSPRRRRPRSALRCRSGVRRRRRTAQRTRAAPRW